MGHTKAAAGAAGLIKAALSLHNKVLPPTCKVTPADRLALGGRLARFTCRLRPGPGCRAPAIPAARRSVPSDSAAVISTASWKKPDPRSQASTGTATCRSSRSRPISREEIGDSLQALKETRDWADVRAEGARSRSRFRPDHRYRLLLVVERGKSDLNGLWPAMAQRRLEFARTGQTLAGPGRQCTWSNRLGDGTEPRACWRCSSPAKVHNTSACCETWLAGFLACKRHWPR